MKNKLALCHAFIKILFLTLSFFSYQPVWSQQKAPVSSPVKTGQEEEDEDNQEIRVEWERLRTMDPATQRIPEGIQKKELQYVRSMTSGLRREKPFENLNTSLYAAAGSIAEDFRNRGPYNVGGRSRALAIDILDDQHILAGGASGGVWSSENQGKSWTRRSSLRSNPVISDIAQDTRKGHESTWYYCTGEYIHGSADVPGNGVFKSTDNGVTWAPLATTIYDNPQVVNLGDYFKYTQNIEVHPATGDIYIASYNGVLKSADGGATFTSVLGGVNHVGAFDVHITTTGVLYAALTDIFNFLVTDGIYRSTTGNAGDWTKISPENFPKKSIRAVIGSAPSNSNVLYFLVTGTPSAHENDIWKYTYVSGNGSGAGGTWVNRTGNIPKTGASGNGPFDSQGGYDLLLKVHPENENTVFIGGTSLYRSTDGFATSKKTTKLGGYDYLPHHPDQHALVFFNSNPNRALSGCDGGIFLTNDVLVSAVKWSSLNNGYLTTQSYGVSIGPNNTIMSGFQDRDTWYTNLNDPQAVWIHLGGGDGCGNAFSKDGVFAYYSTQLNGLYRSQFTQTNEEVNFQPINPEASCPYDQCNFVTTFTIDPNNEEILYLAGYKTIWRNNRASSATESDGWTEISNAKADNQITAIGISTHPANVVYAGSEEGQIFRIEQAHIGNPRGENISSGKGLPEGNVSCLAVDPRDANRVLAVFSNYNIKSVFLTTDGGNSWNDVSGNLEQNADGTGNGPSVRWLTIVGANAEIYLAGTSTGVYSTSTLNGTQTAWTQVAESSIGNAVVNQIKSRDSDGLVVVGSHGNGLFSGNYQVSSPQIKAVKNPLEITVFVNASPTLLQTSALFTSSAPVLSPLTLSVVSNSERELVTSAVANGTLTLSYTPDKTGNAVIVVRGTDANSNYINTAIIVHITDAQKGQTITFNPIQKRTYKDPVICLQATSNSGLPITYASDNAAIAAVAGNVVTIGNAGIATITATQAGNNFYTAAAAVPQKLKVEQLRQVVTFPDISSKPYGTADFAPGATTNSSSAIKYSSDNKNVATIVDGKIHIKGVGATKITAIAAPPNDNYLPAAIVSQILTVTKGIQTITFPTISAKTYGTADFAPDATTNSSSAITITYRSDNTTVATIVNGKIHITGVGSSVITAQAAADDLYEAASTTRRLTVGKGMQTITFNSIPAKPYGTSDFSPEATTNSTSSITYSSSNTAVATIKDGKIHIVGVGHSNITAFATADAHYEAASNSRILTVGKGIQTITFKDIPAKPYGTSDFSPGATTNSSSAITYSSGNAAVATIKDGKIHIVGVGHSNITAFATADAHYEAASAIRILTVGKGIQTITFNSIPDKPYGTSDFSPEATTNSTSAITYSSDNANVATILNGKIHITGVGNSTITALAATDARYEAASTTRLLTVEKGFQTITFNSIPAKVYGTTDFSFAATTNSTSAITYSSGNTAVATIVNGKIRIVGVGRSNITASATADDHYEAASNIRILTVEKGIQTITFKDLPDKPYGTSDFSPEATTNSTSVITYRSDNADVATIANGKIHIVGVGHSNITASAATDARYEAASTTQLLTVEKGFQTITFNSIPAKVYGASDLSLAATTNSTSAITYSSGNTAVATIIDGKIHITGVGRSNITASTTADDHYEAASNTRILTVGKGIQTITFNSIPAKVYGTSDFSPEATTNSSSAITYSSGNEAVATIVNGKIHITGAGSSVITVSAATDAHYEAASVTQLLTVGKGIQTITFKDIPAKLFGNDDFSPETTTNSSSAITYSSANQSVATIVEGKIHITGAGSSVITASAATDALYEAAADAQQTLTVSKAAQTISIEVPSLTVGGDSYMATPVGGDSGNPVVLTSSSDKVTVSGFTIAPVSAGKAEISATQSGNANYLEAAASVNFCVNPKTPVISKISYNMLSSSEPTGNQWFLDKDPIAEATSQTLLTTKSGNYSVMATIEGCAGLRSEPLVYTGDDSKQEDELTIYPNPANSQLYVVLGGFDINSEASISIYSLVGISLFNKIFMGSKIVTISTSFLQNGAYIILVVQGDKRSSKLFFKH